MGTFLPQLPTLPGSTLIRNTMTSLSSLRSLLIKLIAGAPNRRTRFHDATGARVSLSRLMRNGSRGLGGAILRVLLGYRPQVPWISYDAQARLARHLTPSSRVLEFGSGMSTLWFAGRAGAIVSVEHHPEWYAKVKGMLPQGPAIDYRLASDPATYCDVADEAGFDLVLVDGRFRDQCVAAGLKVLRPGGILYLDNSDHALDDYDGDVPRAVGLIEDAARQNGWRLERFTDFAPTMFFAQAGLLLQREQ